jgi:hypothetical protein
MMKRQIFQTIYKEVFGYKIQIQILKTVDR